MDIFNYQMQIRTERVINPIQATTASGDKLNIEQQTKNIQATIDNQKILFDPYITNGYPKHTIIRQKQLSDLNSLELLK